MITNQHYYIRGGVSEEIGFFSILAPVRGGYVSELYACAEI